MRYQNPYFDAAKAHHTPQGFQNKTPIQLSTGSTLRWFLNRTRKRLPAPPEAGYTRFNQMWYIHPDFAVTENAVWWLGHSTLLFQLEGKTILTDPVFSLRTSPAQWFGPKRKTSLSFSINDLPSINYVLISHNHYDHLDKNTVLALAQRYPDLHFIVPLGLKAWFNKLKMHQVTELDWWDQHISLPITITAVPAQHWSKRTLFDVNRSLWCGFVVSTLNQHFYFAGDTGLTEDLDEIGSEFNLDISFLPIGAYAPEWFMGPQHISPEEAVILHQRLNSKRSFAIHWGAYELADDRLDQPPARLHQALLNTNLPTDDFLLKPIGTHIFL